MEGFNFNYHRKRNWKYYELYLKRFRNNPNPILEMGSGIGLFLEACKNNNIEATGVEFEQEGVEESVRKNLKAIQHDLTNPLSFFGNESFEAVFSNQVIEHLSKAAQLNMVSEAYRLVKPGGQILITSPCRHFERARLDAYHINLLTPSELRESVEKVGFVDCNMGYNRPQKVPEVPDVIIAALWKKYHPDLLSQTATVLAYKPV